MSCAGAPSHPGTAQPGAELGTWRSDRLRPLGTPGTRTRKGRTWKYTEGVSCTRASGSLVHAESHEHRCDWQSPGHMTVPQLPGPLGK